MNNRWVKSFVIVAAVLLGWLLLVLFVISPIAKVVIENKSPDWIGRQIEMKSIRIHPFLGSVKIKDFTLKEQESDSSFVSFKEFYIRISLPKLVTQKVHLRHIWLTDFNVHIAQNDSVFNFSDIIQHFQSDKNPDEIEEDTVPSKWRFLLDDIRLQGGKIRYSDLQRNRSWAIENINLDIPGLHLDNRQTNAGLSLNLPDNGGNLLLKGSYNMSHNAYSITLDLRDIDLNQALPIVQDYANIKQLDALLSGHLKANGKLDDALNVLVSGDVSIDGIDIRDSDRQTILSAERLEVSINSLNPKTMVVRLDSIILDSLSFNYARTKNYDTFSRLSKSKTKTTETTDETEDLMLEAEELESDSSLNLPQKRTLPDVQIGKILARKCNIHYDDKTLPSRFKYDITNLSVRAKNLDLRGKQNHLMINANLPNGGSLMANWQGGIDLDRDNVKIVAMLKNVQLKDLSPFTEYMFAYPIKSGSLSVTSDNFLQIGRLDGTTKLDILDLKLGKKKHIDAQLKKVPLKTAIEMLTDMNGKISLSVPIAGNLNNPKFSLRKIIIGTIGNVLLKATTSPFAAMARSKGFKADDLTQLDLNLLLPDFTLEQYQKIDFIIEMMNEKPDIQLSLIQQFNLNNAMSQLAVFNLKRDFYMSKNNAVSHPRQLSLIDIDKINAIKDGDKQFENYYKPLLQGKGKLADRALNYYSADSIKSEVIHRATRRNRILQRYFVEQKGINQERVSIITANDADLIVYKGKDRFEIKANVVQK